MANPVPPKLRAILIIGGDYHVRRYCQRRYMKDHYIKPTESDMHQDNLAATPLRYGGENEGVTWWATGSNESDMIKENQATQDLINMKTKP